MTLDELRAEVRRQVMNYVELGPMLHVQSSRVAPLLDQTLVRVIARDLGPFAPELEVDDLARLYDVHVARTGERNRVPELSPIEAVEHVIEWLTWSVRANAHWLARTDADGNVLKLLKLGSIAAMVIEADKSIAKLQAGHLEREGTSDAELVMPLADRYGMWLLKTPLSLRNETAMMQHCIGLGGYDRRLAAGTDLFYSLRTRTGKSHATMHVRIEGDKRVVVELRGKQNRMPILRYRRLMLPFLDRMEFDWGRAATHSGILVAEDDRHYPYEELPPHLAVRDLDVSHYRTTVDVAQLPRFKRNLVLGAVDLASIPAGTTFPGDVDMTGSKVTELPSGMVVKGDLDLTSTRMLRRLPPDLVVEGALRLNNSKARSIPGTVRFGRLEAHGIPLQLPKGFHSSGSMDLSEEYGSIGLPEDLVVHGDLLLSGLAIGELPKGLVVEGLLDISNTRVSVIPRGTRFRSLKARGSDLTSLAGIPVVEGDLDISRTRIRRLRSLRVGGRLDISATGIRWLPGDLRVGGPVLVNSTVGQGDPWHRRWLDDRRSRHVLRASPFLRCELLLPDETGPRRPGLFERIRGWVVSLEGTAPNQSVGDGATL